ncbi:unnamed protein product [Boreogadus saida]
MSRKKLAWANKEVETFVCILGEEDVVYDVYVAAAAIDIRPTTKDPDLDNAPPPPAFSLTSGPSSANTPRHDSLHQTSMKVTNMGGPPEELWNGLLDDTRRQSSRTNRTRVVGLHGACVARGVPEQRGSQRRERTWEQALQRTARDAEERQKAEREVEACPGGWRESSVRKVSH